MPSKTLKSGLSTPAALERQQEIECQVGATVEAQIAAARNGAAREPRPDPAVELKRIADALELLAKR